MKEIRLGLRENWRQFTVLVIVNAFVGGMVGLERTIFPEFAETQFGIASKSALLSFIVAFGLSKAIANYYMGRLANRFGRRKLLLLGKKYQCFCRCITIPQVWDLLRPLIRRYGAWHSFLQAKWPMSIPKSKSFFGKYCSKLWPFLL